MSVPEFVVVSVTYIMAIYAVRGKGLFANRAKAIAAAGPQGNWKRFDTKKKARAYLNTEEEEEAAGAAGGDDCIFLEASTLPSLDDDPLFLEAEGDVTTLQDGSVVGGYTVRFGWRDHRNVSASFGLPRPTKLRCCLAAAQDAVRLGQEHAKEGQEITISTPSRRLIPLLKQAREGRRPAQEPRLVSGLHHMSSELPVSFYFEGSIYGLDAGK